jgi:pilus assembly protein CpaF
MIKLTLTEKGGEPRVLTFDKDEITIGRVSGNDIVLAKGNVSKRHSKLALRGGQMEVSDLKSTNGTYVNGRKIAGPTMLGPSDRVYVGDFLIGIEGGGEAAAAAGFGGADAFAAVPTASGGTSGARRLPVPPPPPPPRSTSGAMRLPIDEDDDGPSHDEEDEPGLATRPPRATRVPIPPPPPPPPRRPTPLASHALEDALADQGLDIPEPAAPSHEPSGGNNLEDTGTGGLFAHSRRTDEDGEVGASRRIATANRPGVAVAAPAPAFNNDRSVTGPASSLAGDGAGVAPAFEALLADTAVTQILLTGPDAALVDRGAGLALHTDSLGDPNAVADALWRYANTAYPPPPPDNPVVDVRLPDGTRVSAIFPPASPAGVVASIRRPGLPERALADLVPGGNRDVQTLLDALVGARRNVLLTGDVAALPAALGAVARAVPADRRVVAIGAAARARMGWTDLAPTADMAALVRAAAALRPDHLVVGELAGPEAAELVLTATRGGEGLVAALPGRSAGEVLGRLCALAAPGLGGAASAASLVASAFDVVIQLLATGDGGARIVELAEPRAAGAEVVADVGLSLHSDGSKRDPAAGRLQGRGVSARLAAALASAGHPVPGALVGK